MPSLLENTEPFNHLFYTNVAIPSQKNQHHRHILSLLCRQKVSTCYRSTLSCAFVFFRLGGGIRDVEMDKGITEPSRKASEPRSRHGYQLFIKPYLRLLWNLCTICPVFFILFLFYWQNTWSNRHCLVWSWVLLFKDHIVSDFKSLSLVFLYYLFFEIVI